MIAVIRMKGKFTVHPDVKRTLQCLALSRLYSCTIVPDNDSMRGMLQAAKDVVAYGEVDEQAIALLLSKRGKLRDGKKLSVAKKPEEIAKLAKEIAASGKTLSQHSIHPVFSLSPPRGGFGSRKTQAQEAKDGVLGKNAHMSALISRMA